MDFSKCGRRLKNCGTINSWEKHVEVVQWYGGNKCNKGCNCPGSVFIKKLK